MKTMGKLSTLFAYSLLAATPLAHGLPYSHIVAFGDSLTDTGQYPDAESPTVEVGGNPVPTESFRFTNRVGPSYQAPEPIGPIAIEHLARGLGLSRPNPSSSILPGSVTGAYPGLNYALAGAESSKILSSIVDPGGATVSIGTSQTERDGYLVEFPSADPSALYYLNGGANDILSGTVTDVDGIVAAADNIAAGFNALHAAGAKYIVVANMPDLGNTAMAPVLEQGNPELIANMSQLSLAYNDLLYQRINESNANVLALDLSGLLAHVTDNLDRFGFTSATTCFDNRRSGSLCTQDPIFGVESTTPTPDNLVFFDDVHPTTRSQMIIADYALSTLTAPGLIAMLPAIGLEIVQGDLRALQSANMATQSLSAFGDHQGHYAISGTANEINNPVYGTQLNGNTSRFTLTGQRRMNKQWRIGGNATLSRGEFDSATNVSRINLDGTSVSAFMLFNDNRYHSSGTVTYSHFRYGDIYRHSPLGNQTLRLDTADTKGSALTAHIATLYDISFEGGNWEYGPAIDIFRTDITVDGYSEASGSITALEVSEQKWVSTQVTLGVFAQFLNPSATLSLTTKLGLMDEYSLGDETVGLHLASLNVRPAELPGYQATSKSTGIAQVNLTYSPWAVSRISLIYNGSYGQHEQESIELGLTFHF